MYIYIKHKALTVVTKAEAVPFHCTLTVDSTGLVPVSLATTNFM